LQSCFRSGFAEGCDPPPDAPKKRVGKCALHRTVSAGGTAPYPRKELYMKSVKTWKNLSCLLFLLVVLFSLTACGSSMQNSNFAYTGDVSSDAASVERSNDAAENRAGGEEMASTDQKLVYTANVTIETSGYADSVAALRQLIQDFGAGIENESESTSSSGSEKIHYSYFTVRVDPERLNDFLDRLPDIGSVTARSLSSENITQVYNDNEVQIAALEKEEQRLLEMMDKAETVEEMIAVESRLTEVETQLNQYKTQKSYYDNEVRHATVYIDLEEVQSYQDVGNSSGFWGMVKKTFRNSIHALGTFFVWLFTGILWLLPFAALACIVWLIVRAIRKKKKQKNGAAALKEPVPDDEPSEETGAAPEAKASGDPDQNSSKK